METLQNAMIECESDDGDFGRCEHAAVVAVKVVAVHEVQRNGLEICGSAEHKSVKKPRKTNENQRNQLNSAASANVRRMASNVSKITVPLMTGECSSIRRMRFFILSTLDLCSCSARSMSETRIPWDVRTPLPRAEPPLRTEPPFHIEPPRPLSPELFTFSL